MRLWLSTARLKLLLGMHCALWLWLWLWVFEVAGQTNLNQGLIAYYPFNGNANDASGNGHDGTAQATPAADRFGNPEKAYDFDGVSNYIYIGSGIDPSVFTLCAWIWINHLPTGHPAAIISKLHGNVLFRNFELRVEPSGHLWLHVPDGSGWAYLQSSQLLSTQTWSHVAATYDGATAKLYIDGGPDPNQLQGAYVQSDDGVAIGARPEDNTANGGPSYFFSGIIDDVRIYNRALAVGEIARLADTAGIYADQTVRNVNYYYDRNDRLTGAEYSKGISIAYQYDGNGNILRQTVLARASETNRLPVLWQLQNGLTNGIAADGAWGDADGDGWSNYAEWLAGTDPINTNSLPGTVAGPPGTNISSISLPFIPSHFVMAIGQLSSQGPQQIVIGADGDPGTNSNAIFILSEKHSGWTTQRVDVGAFGVTSIAIGRPTNRLTTNVYVGLRKTGGAGGIIELSPNGSNWQSTNVATSSDEAGYIFGVRGTNDLLASFSANGLTNALFGLGFSNGQWTQATISTESSHRGLGTDAFVASRILRDASIRLLDNGGVEVIGGDFELLVSGYQIPTNAIYNAYTGKWCFQTPYPSSWQGAQNQCASFHGNLAAIQDINDNMWIATNFPTRPLFIGLFHNVDGSEGWASGSTSPYRNWASGFPCPLPWSCGNPVENYGAAIMGDYSSHDQLYVARWYGYPQSGLGGSFYGIGEAIGDASFYTNQWLLPELAQAPALNWRGGSLASGLIRPNVTNLNSIVYFYVEDVNSNGVIDSVDNFVTAEYSIQDNNWTTNTLVRVPIPDGAIAQSYSLAVVNFKPYESNLLFTAQPDGNVYYWQATNSTDPLSRQLFTTAHRGKAWHALAGVKLTDSGQALAGLRVDPAHPSTCDVILWPPQYALAPAVSIPQTAPTALVQPAVIILSGTGIVGVSISDVLGNPVNLRLQYRFPVSTNWHDATILNVDGLSYARSIRVSTTPEGKLHALTWNAFVDLGVVQTNVLVRAQATDVAMTGPWSAPVPYAVDTSPPFQIDAGTTNLQLATKGFEFQISGLDGTGPVVIYGSTNLFDWMPIFTNPAFIGTLPFLDPNATNLPFRFYRASEQ